MRKSDLVALWVAGLWTVFALIGMADSRDPERSLLWLPVMFIGWVICGLVWITIRRWPRSGSSIDGTSATRTKRAKVLSLCAGVLGYVLALGLLVWLFQAHEEMSRERTAVQRIVTGKFNLSDCVALPQPQSSRCIETYRGFVPSRLVPVDDLPRTVFDELAQQTWQQYSKIQAIFGEGPRYQLLEDPQPLTLEPVN